MPHSSAGAATPVYLPFWGKAQPVHDCSSAYHPLAYHCLDVAAVTQEFLLLRPRLLNRLAQALGVDAARMLCLAGFLAGGHDLGKFHPCFVAKQPELFERIFPGVAIPDSAAHPHSAVGLTTLLQYVAARWYEDLDFEDGVVPFLEPVINAACGHHGRAERVALAECLPRSATRAAQHWLDDLAQLMAVGPSFLDLTDEHSVQSVREASFELAGLITLCDWIGSNQAYFPYTAPGLTLAEYYAGAQAKAQRALAELGLGDKAAAHGAGFSTLYPGYADTPTPLQRYADTVELPAQGAPALFILEDETGAGKTEAAMTLASRLLANGNAEGVLVSLPTQTTANSLFKRVAPLAAQFFAPDARPSLALAHGKGAYALGRMLSNDLREGDISAELNAWCTDSSKTALLADFGVCTVDQAVLSALPVKHHVLRHLGLGRKVLVVDEAHACEPYLMELLALTLRLHAQRGGSAIVLSATLPRAEKLRLSQAFAEGAGTPVPRSLSCDDYPLATKVDAFGAQETPVASARRVRQVQFKPIRQGEETALIHGWLEQGDCICLLRNTVRAAQRAYDQYKSRFPDQVELVHARFTARHRNENDDRLLGRFGKEADAAGRRGRLVIATQVAEQSLDVDFDRMVTDLAPLDALLQRAGRHRRHARSAQGFLLADRLAQDGRPTDAVYVIMPRAEDNAEFLSQLSPFTALVYDEPAVLHRTACLIEDTGAIELPTGVRAAMEHVYDRTAPVPAFLEEADDLAQDRTRAERQKARFVRLDPTKGYSQDQPGVAHEECVTRLGEPSLRLVLTDSTGRPICGDEEESSLSVRASLVQKTADADGRTRLCMHLEGSDVWSADVFDAYGRKRLARYSAAKGFSVSEPLR